MEAIPSKTDLKVHGNQSLTFKLATANSTAMIGMHLSFTDDSVFRIYTGKCLFWKINNYACVMGNGPVLG